MVNMTKLISEHHMILYRTHFHIWIDLYRVGIKILLSLIDTYSLNSFDILNGYLKNRISFEKVKRWKPTNICMLQVIKRRMVQWDVVSMKIKEIAEQIVCSLAGYKKWKTKLQDQIRLE